MTKSGKNTRTACLLLALLVFSTPSCWKGPSEEPRLLHTADGRVLTLNEALPDIVKAKIVIMGELHSRQSHHEAQLQLIRRLKQQGLPLAVGLEMFAAQHQDTLDRWITGNLDESELRKVFDTDWGFPWKLYREIFMFARERKIPLVALNVPREITRQVASHGFGSLTSEQLAQLPPVTCDVDEAYREFLRKALGAHGHGSHDFERFCEAQLLWDTAMAVHALGYLARFPDRSMVILAGEAHAWKPGIPRRIAQHSDTPVRVILPEIPERLTPQTVGVEEADYLWLGL